jgi:hypothetical protein
MIVAAEAANKLQTVNQQLLNLAVYSVRIYHHEGKQTKRYEMAGARCTYGSNEKCGDPFSQIHEGKSGQTGKPKCK